MSSFGVTEKELQVPPGETEDLRETEVRAQPPKPILSRRVASTLPKTMSLVLRFLIVFLIPTFPDYFL